MKRRWSDAQVSRSSTLQEERFGSALGGFRNSVAVDLRRSQTAATIASSVAAVYDRRGEATV